MNRTELQAEIARLQAALARKPKVGEVWANHKYTKDPLRLIVTDAAGNVFAVSPITGKYKGKGNTFDQYEFECDSVEDLGSF